jgi:ketosteroid isomerase-like protein
MMKACWIVALLVWSIAGWAMADELADAKKAIAAGNAAWSKAFKVGDASAIARLFDAKGVQFEAGGKVARGVAQIQRQTAAMMKEMGPTVLTIRTLEVWLHEGRAYESGKYRYQFKDKAGAPQILEGRYVTIWRRQPKGGYRVAIDWGLPE